MDCIGNDARFLPKVCSRRPSKGFSHTHIHARNITSLKNGNICLSVRALRSDRPPHRTHPRREPPKPYVPPLCLTQLSVSERLSPPLTANSAHCHPATVGRCGWTSHASRSRVSRLLESRARPVSPRRRGPAGARGEGAGAHTRPGCHRQPPQRRGRVRGPRPSRAPARWARTALPPSLPPSPQRTPPAAPARTAPARSHWPPAPRRATAHWPAPIEARPGAGTCEQSVISGRGCRRAPTFPPVPRAAAPAQRQPAGRGPATAAGRAAPRPAFPGPGGAGKARPGQPRRLASQRAGAGRGSAPPHPAPPAAGEGKRSKAASPRGAGSRLCSASPLPGLHTAHPHLTAGVACPRRARILLAPSLPPPTPPPGTSIRGACRSPALGAPGHARTQAARRRPGNANRFPTAPLPPPLSLPQPSSPACPAGSLPRGRVGGGLPLLGGHPAAPVAPPRLAPSGHRVGLISRPCRCSRPLLPPSRPHYPPFAPVRPSESLCRAIPAGLPPHLGTPRPHRARGVPWPLSPPAGPAVPATHRWQEPRLTGAHAAAALRPLPLFSSFCSPLPIQVAAPRALRAGGGEAGLRACRRQWPAKVCEAAANGRPAPARDRRLPRGVASVSARRARGKSPPPAESGPSRPVPSPPQLRRGAAGAAWRFPAREVTRLGGGSLPGAAPARPPAPRRAEVKRGRGRGERRARPLRPAQAVLLPAPTPSPPPPPPEEAPWLGAWARPRMCPWRRARALAAVSAAGGVAATRRDRHRFAGRGRPGHLVKAGRGPGLLPSAAASSGKHVGGRELRGKPQPRGARRHVGSGGRERRGLAVTSCKPANLRKPRRPRPPGLSRSASRQLPPISPAKQLPISWVTAKYMLQSAALQKGESCLVHSARCSLSHFPRQLVKADEVAVCVSST